MSLATEQSCLSASSLAASSAGYCPGLCRRNSALHTCGYSAAALTCTLAKS